MKQSILKTCIVCCTILLPACLLYQSCRKQDHVEQVRYDLTVSDGKAIYEKASAELQTRFGSTYGQLDPRWGESKVNHVSARDAAMYTPLAYNKQTGAYLQLVTMKNKGKLRSIITEMKPTPDFHSKHVNPHMYARLSGHLLFYTVTEGSLKDSP